MKRKIPALLISIIMVLSCLTSCGSNGDDAKIVTPIDNEPQYLDPQIVSQTSAKNIVLNCFEGLVAYNENGEIVPAAAESYDVSADGLTYTFHLRKDGAWLLTRAAKKNLTEEQIEAFDKRVLAKDFVFAFQRALKSETLCPYAVSLMNIQNADKVLSGEASPKKLGVNATDDYTLVITLERADADFPDTLTSPACMPCKEDYFELTKGRYGLSNEYLIYNGPFYISNWAEKTAISCRRNKEYHSLGDKLVSSVVKPYSIYFSFNNEQETRAKKLKDKTYTLAPLSARQAAEISQIKHMSVKQFGSATTSLVFNCSDELTGVKEIRKALAYGVDSSIFLEKFGEKAASGILPSSVTVNQTSYRSQAAIVKTYPQKNPKAISLMKDGMDKLGINDIELTILCETENETAVRVAMQSWQSVFGVKFGISVDAVSQAELMQRISQGNFQIALCDIKFTDVTAKNAIASFATGGRNNIIKFSDEKFDEIIGKLSKTGSKGKLTDIITEAEAYLISSCAIIPICETETYYGLAKGVSGVVFSPTGEVAYYKSALEK